MNNKKSKIGDIINLTKEETKIITILDIIKRRVENVKGDEYLDLNINDEFRLEDLVTTDQEHNDELEVLESFTNLVSV